jgi:AmmeMemoRadiSam system protein B
MKACNDADRREVLMRSIPTFWGMVLILIAAAGIAVAADPRQELLDSVGIPPAGGMRGLVDTVGYATTAVQMDSVVAQGRALAAPRNEALLEQHRWTVNEAFAAAVCPHDDYYYAGRLYALLIPHIRAKTVIVFGVFHRAAVFDCRDKLVFDAFRAWRGPYGPVKISPIRDELISRLPRKDLVVDDDMEMVEHSVEGIVPWLQAYDRDVEIVPILVPYMGWDTLDRIAGEVSGALAGVMKERGLRLGRDVAIIASSDAVHYGDAGWGGSNFADFGTGIEGYAAAVDRDRGLASSTLTGPIRRENLREFLYTCVDRDDVTRYKVTWCGRFSVPFGLDVASRVSEALDGRTLTGTLLDYGTSVAESSLDLDAVPGLGTTAPNNLHHWVGYASIGYR